MIATDPINPRTWRYFAVMIRFRFFQKTVAQFFAVTRFFQRFAIPSMIRSSESGVDFGCSANPAMFSLFIRSRLSTARYIAEMRLEAVPCVPACHRRPEMYRIGCPQEILCALQHGGCSQLFQQACLRSAAALIVSRDCEPMYT